MYTIQFFSTQFAYPGAQPLFAGINITLPAGVCGLAGKNGCGKSTLLKLIAGALQPTHGRVAVSSAAPLRFLAQSPAAENGSLLPLSTGESKMRNLAELFEVQSGILLLDEPEAHLDAQNRTWLLRRLRKYGGTVILVSHDEALLAAADSILHLENGRLTLFSMPYAEYREEILARRNREQAAVLKKQHEMTRVQRQRQVDLERQVRRANNAARRAPLAGIPRIARGMMKRNAERTLGKIVARSRSESAAAAVELAALRECKGHTPLFAFAAATREKQANARIEVRGFGLAVHDGALLWRAPLDFLVSAGERLHLQGPNGSGKSQFLSALVGKAALRSVGQLFCRGGKVLLIDAAFSAVQQDAQVLDIAREFLDSADDGELRRLLGAFGYASHRVFLPFHALSSGEKMRLYLLLISKSLHAVAVILFDEAEAGLDIETKKIVADYLLAFPGVVVFTSHDIRFSAMLQAQQTISLIAM